MKKGKITENVLKRSVLKYIHKKNDEVIKGAGIGEDCAFLCWKPNNMSVSTQTMTLPIKEAGKYAVYATVNNLAAGGAKGIAVSVSITLPVEGEEVRLQELMKQIVEVCDQLQIQVTGGHTEVTDAVKSPIVTVTAFGTPMQDVPDCTIQENGKPGLSIVMTKWLGLEGTVILAKEKEEELLARYPAHLIKSAQGFEKYLPIIPEAATALKSGVCAMHDVRNGGVFGALFELSRRMGVGLSVNLKQIPVKQETIEICEFFDLNPYELLSGGCLLVVTENGEKLVEDLRNENIPAAIIGETISSNDKIVVNGEETRFLEPAGPDEICKINFVPANKIR